MKARAKTKFDLRKLRAAARKGSFKSLNHAAAVLRLTARRSIKKGSKPSAPGSPPHTRQGRLRGAIKYAVAKDKLTAVIGPDAENFGDAGKAHEFGGKFRRERYQKRSFMGPALQQVQDRLPSFWAGSVKS